MYEVYLFSPLSVLSSYLLLHYPVSHQQDDPSPAQGFIPVKREFFLTTFGVRIWVSVKRIETIETIVIVTGKGFPPKSSYCSEMTNKRNKILESCRYMSVNLSSSRRNHFSSGISLLYCYIILLMILLWNGSGILKLKIKSWVLNLNSNWPV